MSISDRDRQTPSPSNPVKSSLGEIVWGQTISPRKPTKEEKERLQKAIRSVRQMRIKEEIKLKSSVSGRNLLVKSRQFGALYGRAECDLKEFRASYTKANCSDGKGHKLYRRGWRKGYCKKCGLEIKGA